MIHLCKEQCCVGRSTRSNMEHVVPVCNSGTRGGICVVI